jgi:deoxyguanosine kinase
VTTVSDRDLREVDIAGSHPEPEATHGRPIRRTEAPGGLPVRPPTGTNGDRIFVAIEGPTGAGKTTLASRLAPVLNAKSIFDPFETNPFLPQILTIEQAGVELALRVELTFFALRVAQLHQIATLLEAGKSVVADWALLKQPIFAATTLAPADVARVAATVDVWAESLPTPEVLIGLSASPSTLRTRVRQRDRDIEVSLTGAQLAALSAAYETAYTRWTRPLIRVDAATFDVFDERHLSELVRQVRQLPIGSEL